MAIKSSEESKKPVNQKDLSVSKSKRRKRKNDKSDDTYSSPFPSNKKRALKAERQSHRKHATTVRSAKEIWNKLRVKTNDKETNAKLGEDLHSLLKGKYMEVAMQHDASRCVQGVLRFGNKDQRREVVMELCDACIRSREKADSHSNQSNINLAELCKIQYAHFVVLKMIQYCARDGVCVKLIVKSLQKQITKLAVHSVGSRVVELLFAALPSKSTSPLKLQLYGPQYTLFASGIPRSEDASNKDAPLALPTLVTFIKNNPDKLESTLSHLQMLLQKGLDKSLTGFAYFHSLLLDYTSVASSSDIRSFLAPPLSEHSLHLLSTREGTKVVCECFAFATAKDRKKMIKCLKGYTRSSLLHRDAYLAILRMCDVMDDTVLVNKMLLAELHTHSGAEYVEKETYGEGGEPSPILDLVLSETGSKLFLLLLVSKEKKQTPTNPHDSGAKSNVGTPRWQKYFDPYELSVLHPNLTISANGSEVPTSKKDDETRRRELAVYVKDLLVEVCIKHTSDVMRSKAGSRMLVEVCEAYPNDEIFNAIVKACIGENNGQNDDGNLSLPMMEDPNGHLMLKQIFLLESEKHLHEGQPSLAHRFYSEFKDRLGEIALTNRGAFVLSALMKTDLKEKVKEVVKDYTNDIAELAKGGKHEKKLAGCCVLLEALKS